MSPQREASRRPDLSLEWELQRSGVQFIAGLDEAGRGAWAGPVTAAAVILPLEQAELACALEGVRDSKQMTPHQREVWEERIRRVALAVGVGHSSSQEVDQMGLIPATQEAMRRALKKLRLHPQHLLVDHLQLSEVSLPQSPVTHGDRHSLSIAAASVVAKVARDRTMVAVQKAFPGYGFAQHKGYGTEFHRAALHQLGPCSIHRRSYRPVSALLSLPE